MPGVCHVVLHEELEGLTHAVGCGREDYGVGKMAGVNHLHYHMVVEIFGVSVQSLVGSESFC